MKAFLKTIYGMLPFKRGFFIAVRSVWRPPERIFRHLHFKGVIRVKLDNSRSFRMMHHGYQIENQIFWAGITGGWEKESLRLWLQLCEEAEVIFDIGANTGVYALAAKAVNPRARVYAFEPVQRVFQKLTENISLNGFDIVAVNKAVSDREGKAVIYDTNNEHVLSVTVNKNLSSPQTPVVETEIETVSLDHFISLNRLKKADLLKIDVETHEPEVIQGFSQYLEKFRPDMLIEILSDEIGEKVGAMVNGLGYLYYNINEKGSIRQVDKIGKSDYFNYLICRAETAAKLRLPAIGAE